MNDPRRPIGDAMPYHTDQRLECKTSRAPRRVRPTAPPSSMDHPVRRIRGPDRCRSNRRRGGGPSGPVAPPVRDVTGSLRVARHLTHRGSPTFVELQARDARVNGQAHPPLRSSLVRSRSGRAVSDPISGGRGAWRAAAAPIGAIEPILEEAGLEPNRSPA